MRTNTPNEKSRRGQSLIEALVALTILIIGFMGVLTLLSRSLSLQRVTSDQAKATYLASEGLEVAKNLIDHNVYLGVAQPGDNETGGWAGTISGTCFNFSAGTNAYYVDFTTVKCPTALSANAAPDPVYFKLTDASTGAGLYYSSADAPVGSAKTPFSRVVQITRSSEMMDVVSIVTWSTGGFTNQSIKLEDKFYNWHP